MKILNSSIDKVKKTTNYDTMRCYNINDWLYFNGGKFTTLASVNNQSPAGVVIIPPNSTNPYLYYSMKL